MRIADCISGEQVARQGDSLLEHYTIEAMVLLWFLGLLGRSFLQFSPFPWHEKRDNGKKSSHE